MVVPLSASKTFILRAVALKLALSHTLARLVGQSRTLMIGGLAVSCLLLSSCATITRGSSQTFTVESNPSEADGQSSQNPTASQQYRIAKGDKIKINTFGEDRFSGEFVVHGDGKITFPLFGRVPAAGLTAEDLAATIANRLAPDYLREPQVTAEVIDFRPVYILGEVAKPGQYPYVEGLTMYALIAQAGGHSYRANRNYVYVRRDGYTAEHRVQVISGTPVQPGDTIRIPQRIF